MQQFIQSLESRTFLSATLLADQAAIAADAAAVKTAVKTLASQNRTLLAAITVDLKKLPKTNAVLLKAAKTAATKLGTLTTADQAAITTSSGKLAKKAVTAGDTLLTSWTSKGLATVEADAATLNSILAAPLGKLGLDLTGPLITDLGVLATANPTASQLAADIAAEDAAYAVASMALTNAAAQYSASISTLSTDLSAIPAIPNVLFNYSGTVTDKVGVNKGKSLHFTFDFTVEAADGSWTATYSAKNKAGVLVSQPAQGTLSAAGVLNGELANGTIFNGVVNGKTIKGTAISATQNGPFSISHP